MSVAFTAPSGITTQDMDCEALLANVRLGGPGFWKTGSFSAYLLHAETENTIVLIVEPGLGVYVRYCACSGEDEFALIDPEVSEPGMVVLYPGAEPMEVPRAQLVSEALCADILRKFWSDGRRPPARWVVVGLE